jgi:hypothetical protein
LRAVEGNDPIKEGAKESQSSLIEILITAKQTDRVCSMDESLGKEPGDYSTGGETRIGGTAKK